MQPHLPWAHCNYCATAHDALAISSFPATVPAPLTFMWPEHWQKYKEPSVLTWDSVPFEASQKSSLPDQPGVYAFIIQAEMSAGLQPSYLVYIGQTTNQTLKERFGQYLREIGKGIGRPKLVAHLPLYEGHTHFHFAEIPNGSAVRPKDVESKLLSGFVPPFNSDFEGEVSEFRSAFGAS